MGRMMPIVAMLAAVGLAGCSQRTSPERTSGREGQSAVPAAVDAPKVVAEAPPGHAVADAPAEGAAPGEPAAESAPRAATAAAAAPADAAQPAPELDAAIAAQVNPLLSQMSSDASLERLAAAESLDALGPVVVPYLVAALERGSEAERRGAAAYLIGRVSPRDEQLAAALIGALTATDDVLRRHALQAVEKLAPEQVVRALPALTALAQHAQEETAYRVRAVRAMAKPGAAARDALPFLRQTAQDPATPELQRAAFDAVAKVATPEDTERFLLEALSQSPDKDLRRLAAKRLVQGALSPPAITGLIDAFKDAEAEVRNEAIKSLVAIGKPAVPQLVEALRHADVQVRRRAVTTLGQLNRLAGDAVPDLQARLQDPDPEVRNLASAALRLIQGP